ADLARFALMAVLIGAYFTLWRHRRDQTGAAGWGMRLGRQGGALGAAGSVCGLATGGCTVMGCGAPVIPVVGLAFVRLSSGTLAWLWQLSHVAPPRASAWSGRGAWCPSRGGWAGRRPAAASPPLTLPSPPRGEGERRA